MKIQFHADSDGITSAFFLSKELNRLKLRHSLRPSLGAYVDIDDEDNIILDISQVTSKHKRNLVIDHHVAERANCLYANPRLAGFEWPVSFTSYALFGNKLDAWVSAVGVVGDWGAEKVPKQFWSLVKSQWPELVDKVNQKKMVQGPFGEMSWMIDSSISFDRQKGALYALEALKTSAGPAEFLDGKGKASKLKKNREKIDKEIDYVFGNELVTDKFILLRYGSKHRIKSLVAARAKDLYPNKLIIIAQDDAKTVRISLRGGKGLNTLITRLTDEIGAGGGHPEASGGWVEKKSWSVFEKRLFDELG
ncbi:MAG: DHH family phosphoesterase [Candidatus Altiarchaeota archaeon]|nr:DHH family phosphoesterase [Candidatus Altiarchaeota archaeon]